MANEQMQTPAINHADLARLLQPAAQTATGGVSTGSHATDTFVAGVEKLTGFKGSPGLLPDAQGLWRHQMEGLLKRSLGRGLDDFLQKRFVREHDQNAAFAGLQELRIEHVEIGTGGMPPGSPIQTPEISAPSGGRGMGDWA